MKPKGRGRQRTSCESVSDDLISWSICSNCVCEKCNDVQVKVIRDKCSGLDFICKGTHNPTS